MDNIVKFSLAIMTLLVLALGAVMYTGAKFSAKSTGSDLELEQVQKWLRRAPEPEAQEVVRLGKKCSFAGEAGVYRTLHTRLKGAGEKAPVNEHILYTTEQGEVVRQWRVQDFIESKTQDAAGESTPERRVWKRDLWNALLKQLGVSGSIGELPAPPGPPTMPAPAPAPASPPAPAASPAPAVR